MEPSSKRSASSQISPSFYRNQMFITTFPIARHPVPVQSYNISVHAPNPLAPEFYI